MTARYLFVFLMLPMLISCIGCKGKMARLRETYLQTVAQSQEKYDKIKRGHEVDKEKSQEAEHWLEFTNTSNIMVASDKGTALKFTKRFYALGSPRVMCIYTEAEGMFKSNNCYQMLIELPKDPDQRRKILEYFTETEKTFWGKDVVPVQDTGQTFLHLNMLPNP